MTVSSPASTRGAGRNSAAGMRGPQRTRTASPISAGHLDGFPSKSMRTTTEAGSVRGPVAGPLIGDRDHDPYFVAGRRVAARSPIFRP